MNKSDLKDIKLNGPAFRGDSWWKKKASSACQNQGVEKALQNWQTQCKPVTDLVDLDEAVAAEKACRELSSALTKAKGKCRKLLDNDTKSAIEKMQSVVSDYEKLLATEKKTLEEDEREAGNLVQGLKTAKTREMFYGLVRKGQSARLVVSKKPQACVRMTRKFKAKDEDVRGGKVFVGKCDFEGGKIRFHFQEKPPNLKPVLKRVVAEANMKPAIIVNGVEFDDGEFAELHRLIQLNIKTIIDAGVAPPDQVKGWLETVQNAHRIYENDLEPQALTELNKIEPEVRSFLGQARTAGTSETTSPVVAAESTVRKARIDAVKGVNDLVSALRSTGDERAGRIADFLVGLATELPQDLERVLSTLSAAVEQGEPPDKIRKLRAGIQTTAKQWLAFLNTNSKFIEGVETNPFNITVRIKEPVQNALKSALQHVS